ncbi:bifunctional acetate--CoA ligase family protein/GNAT family N-acetyltransferase [Hyphomicrobium sp.]|uniref:bifunctional acetate--CoA ligase family protein/GNAT family N-acetyltransferase n=1 Tax=Hyphomicrobium sp. TaxID=82 RepID=UPI001DBD63AC|nr:bifunctional acetate--CoA ligase family protein/GNAT family N-acetyltransferase [Hyphomicrobium sp.]MBY0560472.1 bifunctional acetate--CoA ligase family protein/GNAT family N-acetyltransferase [Hyphomicrobium sp.]
MTIRNLTHMMAPKSVVLIGASPKPGSVGLTVLHNLSAAGFAGGISLVNPNHSEVAGRQCYGSVNDLPAPADLAVIAAPPAAVPGIIADLGRKGTRAAIVLTAGVGPRSKEMLEAARPYCLRILGPNCIGLMVPQIGLNASFAHRAPLAGDLAFVSQSGALVTAIIDWAAARNIGFSHVVSLGEMADIDLGDMLDYLATDRSSRAILLYIEAVTHAPKFLSAARHAARLKPVVVVKSGRHAGGARAALSHTGALAGSDAAYDAAFRRSGLLRVKTLDELFAAAEILAHAPKLGGERLAILTNGGGAGVLAADELQDAKGVLAKLDMKTTAALDKVLPVTWSHGNPVDIIGDATAKRYTDALHELLQDPQSDAVLVLNCPTAITPARDAAAAVINETNLDRRDRSPSKPVITCWLGEAVAKEARELFRANNIPTFATTSEAVTGFMQLVDYARAQTELMQTPPVAAGERTYHAEDAAGEIQRILRAGRTVASALETKTILAAYGIPTNRAVLAKTPMDVRIIASDVLKQAQACVIKIASPDISHKSDVGGVRLGLESAASSEQAAVEMLTRIRTKLPDARIDGFTVEPMISRPNALEIIVGMNVDETFGPMMLFGAGGVAVEVIGDSALALPPLDMLLARQMIAKTRISRLLAGYRDRPAADVNAVADVLVRVSDLIIRHPEIRELDINPLLVDENGVIAIDARLKLADEQVNPRRELAIRPYPSGLQRTITVDRIGEITLRPVRPDDEPRYGPFFARISPEDIRLRFFTGRRELPHAFLAKLTQVDYAREMAFVAIKKDSGELLGVSRLILEPDRTRGEFGVIVRSDLHSHGLGRQLMNALMSYARSEGVTEVFGLVHVENRQMLAMADELGFKLRIVPDDPTVREVVWHPQDVTAHASLS